MLLLYAIAAGILIGVARGGRLSALADASFRWWPLALFGLLFQLLLFSPPVAASVGQIGPALYVGSTALVLIALLPNLRQPGFALIGLGALLNFVVVSANGGQMPASPAGFAALYGVAAVPVEHFSNSVLAGPQTVLPFLGDIFVLPRPMPLANVFSIGDVLIGVGGTLFIVRLMGRRGEPARGQDKAPDDAPAIAPADVPAVAPDIAAAVAPAEPARGAAPFARAARAEQAAQP